MARRRCRDRCGAADVVDVALSKKIAAVQIWKLSSAEHLPRIWRKSAVFFAHLGPHFIKVEAADHQRPSWGKASSRSITSR